MPGKDRNTQAEPMSYEVIRVPNVRTQLQTQALEAAAAEAVKTPIPSGKGK